MRYTQNKTVYESTAQYATDWSSINWHKAEKYVDKLQKRIYHAESIGDSRKVRDLQRMLIRSESAKVIAVKRVTQTNKGKRTPGIDNVVIKTDKQRGELVDKLKTMNINKHKPKPAYRHYIRKKNGKLRPLGIPTIIDRVYQEILRMALEPQAEANFEPISYGFRPKRGVHDAVSRIFNNIHNNKWCWVYEGDFKDCFNNLSHEFILNEIKGFPAIKLVKRFLEAGYVDNNVFNRTNKGTPQGGLLSPLLANIALTGLEKYLNISYKKRTQIRHGETKEFYETIGKYRVVRYADDFVIFAKTKKDIERIPSILENYLLERGLTLAEDKTKITHISDGFDFLGFNFRQYDTSRGLKCFIKPSKDSIKNFKAKVDERIRWNYGHNVDDLINSLNPLIKGTANYWKPTVAKKIFSDMDYYIWNKIYKFLRRLHPNKGWKWIKRKYFQSYNDGYHHSNWILIGPKENNHLTKMSWTPIRRHKMITHNYSPYDKSKTTYFENKRIKKIYA
ncbi:MAG: group II intron reverse transcriptase/maturase [Bacillus sp. (in: Bacteria)]|nr:group II intron reverse transcriptase/maturase [Bacillus sp. (in: firmicutes)]